MADTRSGALLRQARRRAGLSQAQLARRARTTQSVVSAYESAARQPSVPTLARLIAASGLDLQLQLRQRVPASGRRRGALLQRLHRHRDQVLEIAARYGLTNLRVFGSVARSEDTPGSDLDLLADFPQGMGLIRLARCQHELEALLGVRVDLVPASDLKPGVRRSAIAHAIAI